MAQEGRDLVVSRGDVMVERSRHMLFFGFSLFVCLGEFCFFWVCLGLFVCFLS